MFSYYGSKSKVIQYYPSPKFDKIIEPFAGSARYALKYYDRDVLLVDKYDVIIKIWQWLQKCSPNDILGLPRLKEGLLISSLNLSDEEKLFLGFMAGISNSRPRNKVSNFSMIHFSMENRKDLFGKIANNLYKIRHWEIKLGSYDEIPNEKATWFIDPPYQFGGEIYCYGNKELNFNNIALWCQSRQGQSIVCENTKATWLPFYPLRDLYGNKHKTTEAIWSNYPTGFEAQQLNLNLI